MKSFQLLLILLIIWSVCEAGPTPPKRPKKDDFITTFRDWKMGKGAAKIPPDVVAPFLGHGGSYESVQPWASKLNTIESDHAPHNSILEYVDPSNLDRLPENIKKAVKKRKELEAQLATTNYPGNEAKMKTLKPKIDKLTKELNKVIKVKDWEKSLQGDYNKNINEMTKVQKTIDSLKAKPSDPVLLTEIAKHQKTMEDLKEQNKKLREKAEDLIKAPKKAELEPLEKDYKALEKENKGLSKALVDHNEHIKNAMGVLSIPYDKHRIFPSTGGSGLNDEIRALKTADSKTAKAAMETYETAWKANMNKAIKDGYIDDGGFVKSEKGKTVPDLDAIWDHNFDKVVGAVESERTGGKPTKPKTPAEKKAKAERDFLNLLHKSYAKKFMTTAIYYVKTPEDGYGRLQKLYIEEYKMYMKNDFDSYKLGLSKLLEANKQFGWLSDTDINKIKTEHGLPDIGKMDTSTTDPAKAKRATEWNSVEEIIKFRSETSKNPVLPDPTTASTSATTGTGTVCSTSTRRKRSISLAAGGKGNCIFYSKQSDAEIEMESKRKQGVHLDEDGLPKPKIPLPSDGDAVSIDSKRLTKYLDELYGEDIHSVKTKQAVLEYASKHADKLTGTPEEIAAAKARLQQEDLGSHSEKTSIGSKLLRENTGDVSPKAVTKYKQMKISSGKIAKRLGKFTKATDKISNPYGKIMLAKSVVTALRHGDYESLALIGGRIGLDVALHGVTKLGTKIAQKATTKFMTKFGSQFLGKLAGPVGAIADIGISIYSITKSAKILNDPNASKFDRNDAIADIVADSIDIAVTATAAVLSLVFPPLAPVFAAVSFVVNILTTIAVGFYKAANNVDRINAELPLLGHEKVREYWRSLVGDDTSYYIQELIDTKKANNIAVNTTVQFLKDNPDYIGRVFPSRTLFQPDRECWLEQKITGYRLNTFPVSKQDWKRVSTCKGHRDWCSGGYSNRRCDTGRERGYEVFGYHEINEYRCKCGDEPPPQWGYEESDSDVDFRSKQNVHLLRAAPDFLVPKEFTYLCKPSTLTNEGEKVSRPETEWAYLCKNAIGIKRSSNAGKFMLYDLGNGTDSVYLDPSETIDNLFVVQDGHKEFEGNAGDDTFLLDGPCDTFGGWVDGKGFKGHGNSLVLGANCKSSGCLEVDLQSGNVHFQGYTLGLRSIQRVIGRRGKSDTIHADCSTKLIVGSGGASSSDPDEIYLPSSCATDTDVTLALEGSVTVHGGSFTGGKCFVLLQDKGLSIKAKVSSSLASGTLLLFKFQEDVGKMTSASITSTIGGATIQLKFVGGGTASFEVTEVGRHKQTGECQKPTDENPIQILLTENSKFSRHLSFSLTPPGRLQAIHGLTDDVGANLIRGYDFMDNIFYLISGQWNVIGGQGQMNQFILKSMKFFGSIDGTSSPSGQSTLMISSELKESPIRIDLVAGEIKSSGGNINVKNIQRLVGRPEYIEEVVVSCHVKYIELGGTAGDIATIPKSDCSPEVRISAKGKLAVNDKKSKGSTIIDAGYFDPCAGRSGQKLDLSIGNDGGGELALLLNFPISELTAASPSLLNVGGDGGGQVKINGPFPSVFFEEDYNIKSALVEDDGKVLAYHELNVTDSFQLIPKLRKGTNAIPNIFKLEQGKDWRVEGGSKGDVFLFADSKFSGSLFGMGGRNQLSIDDRIQGDVKIKGPELLLEGHKALTFEGIQEIYGRKGQSDLVEAGCDTSLLSMNGGNLQKSDQIIIPDGLSNCKNNLSLTIVAAGFTTLYSSAAAKGKVDTYVAMDEKKRLHFKTYIQVSPNLIFNFPIQVPSYKLSSYQLTIKKSENSETIESLGLKINLMDEGNSLDFTLRGNYLPDHTNWMFIDDDYNSNGNIFINTNSNDLYVLHVLQKGESEKDKQKKVVRKGAVGAKNIFRLHTGTWDAFGGALDDSFILYENGFRGQIHGLQGINSLILNETLLASAIEVDLAEETLKLDNAQHLSVKSIQIVGGRKEKKDIVNCGCDTKLIMLEGGGKNEERDEIHIKDQPCKKEMAVSVLLTNFTTIENTATKGNFSYHVQTSQSSAWDVRYFATAHTNHSLKLEIDLEEVKKMSMISEEGKDGNKFVEINFQDGGTKQFPLNFQRPPSVHIGTGQELMAEILFPENETINASLMASIIARTPFSGIIQGFGGVENGITVKTANSVPGIFGGEKDDNIFLSEVESILIINGGEGENRLQLSDELHRGLDMEVDFQLEKIKFVDTCEDFVTVLQEIDLFVGREDSFERVVLGCDTRSVKWADVVSIRNWDCGYNVKIELGDSTHVKFEWMDYGEEESEEEEEKEEDETTEGTCSKDDESCDEEEEEEDLDSDEEDDDEAEIITENYLELSVFHYHFTSIRSFDIEVDSFRSLRNTTHIFYLPFNLTDLTSIHFSLNDSRLLYSTIQHPSMTFAHLVGKLEPTEMFYSQPEFMTKEGFLLRITRYGEVMAVLGASEMFDLDFIHSQVIPRFAAHSKRLGINFMVESDSAKQFIYAGSAKEDEVDILTNRVNTTSHLIGWNGTTYEIIDMENDTWIYPQQPHVQDAVQVLDLSNIIFQIRNETGRKYVPEVKANGLHLEIMMTNFTNKYPASIFIANGTENAKSLDILLNSIAMEIVPVAPLYGIGEEMKWKIKPRPISIPKGHTYVLAAEDLEDDVEIKRGDDALPQAMAHSRTRRSVPIDTSTSSFGRDNSNLVITSVNTEETLTDFGRYTSFVLFDYYERSQQPIMNDANASTFHTRTDAISNLKVSLGPETVKIASNTPILKAETEEEVHVEAFEYVLQSMEEEILKDFPDIPKRFDGGYTTQSPIDRTHSNLREEL